MNQVAFCNNATHPKHTFPGFTGVSANLPAENSCFGADLWVTEIASTFAGQTGSCQGGNMLIAIQTWDTSGNVCSASGGTWTATIMSTISDQGWESYFNGQEVNL